jgi:hypothetical protein
VDRIVVGHAYANGAITPRFHGKVLFVDIGLSRIYENTGKLGCLEIDEEHPFVLHRGKKIELPKDENGPDTLALPEGSCGARPTTFAAFRAHPAVGG